MRVATNDKVLNLPVEYKDVTRTRILKNMLVNIINWQKQYRYGVNLKFGVRNYLLTVLD